jgi:hypothetical protein
MYIRLQNILQTCCIKKLGIFVVFVTQLGNPGVLLGYLVRLKTQLGSKVWPQNPTQPSFGLGWVRVQLGRGEVYTRYSDFGYN